MANLYIKMWPIKRKGTLWEVWKVSTLVSLRSSHSLTTDETFCYRQIFCVLSEFYLTKLSLWIFKPYWPALASFPMLLFHLGVPIWSLFAWRVTNGLQSPFTRLNQFGLLQIKNLNPWPSNKILTLSKLKAFTNEKIKYYQDYKICLS